MAVEDWKRQCHSNAGLPRGEDLDFIALLSACAKSEVMDKRSFENADNS